VDIVEQLSARGLTLGHEPDSQEFSTMGGWVATRASGMKKNVYGNIEDIIVDFALVTPIGTLRKTALGAPRVSIGPDVLQMAIGSEGTLGIVTDVVVRLRPQPQVQRYGSLVFPNFERGVECLREIALKRLQPASIRLVDNLQFQFGQVLKPKSPTPIFSSVKSSLQKYYVTKIKGFDPTKMCAATLLYEGSKAETDMQSKGIAEIIGKYGGMDAGAENGKRGYFLTYMIAYLRDFGHNFYMCAESFETSVPWQKVLPLCFNVKKRIVKACEERGVPGLPFVSCRVTQTYDTGACVYFYFAFVYHGMKDPVHAFEEVEHEARDEVLAQGGSLSHHHGIGKCRIKWMKEAVSPVGLAMLKALKEKLDPTNVLCCGNLGI